MGERDLEKHSTCLLRLTFDGVDGGVDASFFLCFCSCLFSVKVLWVCFFHLKHLLSCISKTLCPRNNGPPSLRWLWHTPESLPKVTVFPPAHIHLASFFSGTILFRVPPARSLSLPWPYVHWKTLVGCRPAGLSPSLAACPGPRTRLPAVSGIREACTRFMTRRALHPTDGPARADNSPDSVNSATSRIAPRLPLPPHTRTSLAWADWGAWPHRACLQAHHPPAPPSTRMRQGPLAPRDHVVGVGEGGE